MLGHRLEVSLSWAFFCMLFCCAALWTHSPCTDNVFYLIIFQDILGTKISIFFTWFIGFFNKLWALNILLNILLLELETHVSAPICTELVYCWIFSGLNQPTESNHFRLQPRSFQVCIQIIWLAEQIMIMVYSLISTIYIIL